MTVRARLRSRESGAESLCAPFVLVRAKATQVASRTRSLRCFVVAVFFALLFCRTPTEAGVQLVCFVLACLRFLLRFFLSFCRVSKRGPCASSFVPVGAHAGDNGGGAAAAATADARLTFFSRFLGALSDLPLQAPHHEAARALDGARPRRCQRGGCASQRS